MDSPENIERFLNLAPNATYYTGFAQTEAMGVTGGPIGKQPGLSVQESHDIKNRNRWFSSMDSQRTMREKLIASKLKKIMEENTRG